MHYKITVTMSHFKNIQKMSVQIILVTINHLVFSSMKESNGNRFDENMNKF